jgi:hypothetical protein
MLVFSEGKAQRICEGDHRSSGGNMGVSEILAAIDSEIAQLQQARALLAGQAAPKKKPGRPAKGTTAPAAAKPRKNKRNLTPEGRKRISEAVRRRWAAQKKAAAAK